MNTTKQKTSAELQLELDEAKKREAKANSVEASKFVGMIIEKFGIVRIATEGKTKGKTFVNIDNNKLSLAKVEGYDIRTGRYGLVIEKL